MFEPGAGGWEVFPASPGPMDEFWDPGSFFPGIPLAGRSLSDIPLGLPFYFEQPFGRLAPREAVPEVPIFPETGAAGVSDRPLTEADALEAGELVVSAEEGDVYVDQFPPGSIFAPGEVWGDRPEEDWVEVASRYEFPEAPVVVSPQDLEPILEKESDVAVDWGGILGGAAQDILTGWGVGPQLPPGYTPAGGSMAFAPGGQGRVPTTVTVNTATGKVTPCRRRRRRRLLTEGDFNDLMRIATLPNKQNVAVALAKAVGRR